MKKSPFSAVDQYENVNGVQKPSVIEESIREELDVNKDGVVDGRDHLLDIQSSYNNNRIKNRILSILFLRSKLIFVVLIFAAIFAFSISSVLSIFIIWLIPIVIVLIFVDRIFNTIDYFSNGKIAIYRDKIIFILFIIMVGYLVYCCFFN